MIRIGVQQHISVRPLIYGLMRAPNRRLGIIYDEPSLLADALQRGHLDAALIPAIEYLRGTGDFHLDGPALIATASDGSILLVARTPLDAITRVAVGEFCRTPVAALRVVLAEKHRVTPDFLVEKDLSSWRDNYDAVLLSGDAALRCRLGDPRRGDTTHNIAGMWFELTHHPLVSSLWAYRNASHAAELSKTLITSRNLGMQNLSQLADGIAETSEYESALLYEYLSGCWQYDMHEDGLPALLALEERALDYDLLRCGRLGATTT